MKKMISSILCTMLTVFLIFSFVGCSAQNPETSENSDSNDVKTISDGQKSPADETPSEKKTAASNPNLIQEGQFLFFKENPTITDKGDYYEVDNVCVAESGDFQFERSMFEGKKVGDLLHLPNGDFTLDNISDLDGITQFDVSNGHFMHYFVLEGDILYAVGIGENLVLESKYVGPLRFSKNCRYWVQENLELDALETTLQEHIKTKNSPWEHGAFLSVDAIDSENNISAVSDILMP